MTTEQTTAETPTTAPDFIGSASYDPADNKIRMRFASRLPRDLYDRVRAAGFIWAPRQELFVAPMWTPDRADLAEELCGELGDEDTSLVDRAEERAERFDGYSENRAADAETAHAGVAAIADNIPLGQPILIGHHSEKRARKDAERIENGMRKAVKMWETSKYWVQRAKGALRHAKYKELPDVRARRIKGIEADKRKRDRQMAQAVEAHVFWLRTDLTHEEALRFAGSMSSDFSMPKKEGDRKDFDQRQSPYGALKGDFPTLYAPRTLQEVIDRALQVYPGRIDYLSRWVAHYENRLAYEKAMLEDQGASHLIAPKERPKQLPLLNYRAPSVTASRWGSMQAFPQVETTSEDFQRIYSDQRGTLTVDGTHRVRFALVELRDGKPARFADHAKGVWSAIFLTDSKEHTKPGPAEPKPAPAPKPPRLLADRPAYAQPERTKFDDLKDTLRAGVKVVTAPQLFPTPPDLARRMIELADIRSGHRILEPSFGTGALLEPAHSAAPCQIVGVEINAALVSSMQSRLTSWGNPRIHLVNADFLQCNGDLGTFDRIVMNPPFANGVDVVHVRHALNKLNPGGKLVAIVAGGPKQKACLEPLADLWEELPDGTFAEQGTNVRTVLLVIEKPE